MLFVTVNQDRKQLDELTRMLLTVFHGSVIYQHTDPARALRDIREREADAVFVGERAKDMDGITVMHLLRCSCPGVKVFILSESEDYCARAAQMGADGVLRYPLDAQALESQLKTL